MTAYISPVPRLQFFGDDNLPLVGGKLYSYKAGPSATPLATYTDYGAGTPNANPTILDARGEASVWLGAGAYYLVLKDSNDVTIWTQDQVNQIDLRLLSRVNVWTSAQRGEVTTLLSSAASIAINLADSNNFEHTLTENTTLAAPSNPVAGQFGVIEFVQHASAAKTLAYNSFWSFPGGVTQSVTTVLSGRDTYFYYVESAIRAAIYKLIIPSSTGGPSLSTNSVANTNQTLLNLLDGANVDITADGAGGVTVAVPDVLHTADIGVTVEAYDADIAKINVVNSWSKAQIGVPVSLTSTGNSIAVDLSLSNNFTHTMTENTTLAAPSNAVAGQSGVIMFTQHASAAKTLAYNAFWKFPSGIVPTMTATVNAVDAFSYYIESASRATCNMLQDVK